MLIAVLIDLHGIQAAGVDGLLQVLARLLVPLLLYGDIGQDLLDPAALVRTQPVEPQRRNLLRGPGVVARVQELDRFVEGLAGLRVDVPRLGGRRPFFLVRSLGEPRCSQPKTRRERQAVDDRPR